MNRIKKFNDPIEDIDLLKDALSSISDDREISLWWTSSKIYISIIIKDLLIVSDQSMMSYTENGSTKESILNTWETIFQLIEEVKSALRKCNIEYKSVLFAPKTFTFNNDAEEVEIDYTLFIEILL
jgi:hypothetical protein